MFLLLPINMYFIYVVLKVFGIFASLLVLWNFILVISFFPALLLLHDQYCLCTCTRACRSSTCHCPDPHLEDKSNDSHHRIGIAGERTTLSASVTHETTQSVSDKLSSAAIEMTNTKHIATADNDNHIEKQTMKSIANKMHVADTACDGHEKKKRNLAAIKKIIKNTKMDDVQIIMNSRRVLNGNGTNFESGVKEAFFVYHLDCAGCICTDTANKATDQHETTGVHTHKKNDQ